MSEALSWVLHFIVGGFMAWSAVVLYLIWRDRRR